jgi:hypothetical protein
MTAPQQQTLNSFAPIFPHYNYNPTSNTYHIYPKLGI